jgi:hypothetical protein
METTGLEGYHEECLEPAGAGRRNVSKHLSLLYGIAVTGLGLMSILFLLDLGDLMRPVPPPASMSDAGLRPAPPMTAAAVIAAWPPIPRLVAQAVSERYGEPDEVGDDSVIWHRKGSWKRIVVWRRSPASVRGARRNDVLQQVIDYRVPQEKLKELARFDQRIVVSTTSGELSSRSESESLNCLALNLANEIITDRRSVDDAQNFYRSAARLSRSGKVSAYMRGLQFQPSLPAAP